ncbi:12846_t:CDS:2, partial [Ambispora gerdemannii]
ASEGEVALIASNRTQTTPVKVTSPPRNPARNATVTHTRKITYTTWTKVSDTRSSGKC